MSEGDAVNSQAPERPPGPLWWPRRRSAVMDVGLASLSMVECGYQGIGFARDTGIPVGLGVLVGLLAGATLVLRRRFPIAVVLVTLAVTPAQMALLQSIVGLYTLASSDVPRRITALLASMLLGGGLLVTYVELRGNSQVEALDPWYVTLVATMLALLTVVPPVLLGMYVGARRRLVEALRERTDGLERELVLLAERAEERAEWARGEERALIAREMHDVVAHRVSLMVVHAAALQAIALKDPEKASKNAALVGDMGRQALTELRTILGVLRSSDSSAHTSMPTGSSAPVAGAFGGTGQSARHDTTNQPLASLALSAAAAAERGAVAASRTTAERGAGSGRSAGEGPKLGELDQLVEQSRATGMAVELSVEGEARAFDEAVERTAFRVVQEGLTNVHKHAGSARTRVRLAYRGEEVAVQVVNEAPGAGVADSRLPSGGNGLVGIKERITALGGGFVSGPTEAGGFRISAVIPDVPHGPDLPEPAS